MNGNDAIKLYLITGRSMYPEYRDGEIVTGKPFDGVLKRGWCYGFYCGGTKVFHRFLGRRGDKCIFTGDNTSRYEEIPEDAVFFSGDTADSIWYNYSITISNLFFYCIYRINPFKRLKTVCARILYYIINKEQPPWMKKNPISSRR